MDYGPRAVESFPPVTTALAEHVRQTGLRVLGERYRAVAAHSKHRRLTATERIELERTERVLEQLQAMAPIAQLPGSAERGTLEYPTENNPD